MLQLFFLKNSLFSQRDIQKVRLQGEGLALLPLQPPSNTMSETVECPSFHVDGKVFFENILHSINLTCPHHARTKTIPSRGLLEWMLGGWRACAGDT